MAYELVPDMIRQKFLMGVTGSMEKVRDTYIRDILKSLRTIDYIKPNEIPNIDLYMDQVTTFMDKHLQSSKRYEDDKLLTKTMINNYTKNNLLPSPEKKKYTKDYLSHEEYYVHQ